MISSSFLFYLGKRKTTLCIVFSLMTLLQGCESTETNKAETTQARAESAQNKKDSTQDSSKSGASNKENLLKEDGVKQATLSSDINDDTLGTANVAEPLNNFPSRVALLPFVSQNSSVSEKYGNTDEMLYDAVYSHLASTNYVFVRPIEVKQKLEILDKKPPFFARDAAAISETFGADAIIIGKVINSDVTYAGLVAHIFYEIEMSLINKHGEILWSQQFAERSLEIGLSTDPFSMLYSLAVTAMHVGQENIFAVADKIGRQVSHAIPQPDGLFNNKTVFIDSVIHDAAGKSLKYGDVIKVGIKGTENQSASVMIDGINDVFYAKETEKGTYFVDIPVNKNWNGRDLMLTSYLMDNVGNQTKRISPFGLLDFDNTSPKPVSDITALFSDDTLSLAWQHNETNLTYQIFEIVDGVPTLLQQTRSQTLVIDRPFKAFSFYQFAIVAMDNAGNQSDKVNAIHQYLPSKALAQTPPMQSAKLPAVIAQDSRLSVNHSPYLIDQKTILSAEATLYIEPGVTLMFSQSGRLEVQGAIRTFGQAPIVFDSLNQIASDQTFLLINSNKHVELNNFTVQNAGIAVAVKKGKPMFNNCRLIGSQFSALTVTGVANVVVDNCVIDGSNTSAVVVANSARLRVSNSQFMNNTPFHIQNSSNYAVDARNNQWQPVADFVSILGNVTY